MKRSISRAQITGEAAVRILDAALTRSRAEGQAVVVAVVDASGVLVAFAAAIFLIGVLAEGDFFGAPLWTAALLPGLPGAAYIVFHLFVPREPTV